MRADTTVRRGAASVRTIVWGLVALATAATVVYVKVRPPAARRVTTVTKVPVGPLPPEPDRVRILLLEIPSDVHPDADEPGAFSLEYRLAAGEPAVPCGRCRLVVKDDYSVLGEWEGVPGHCDWHQPNPGAILGWSPAGTPLERPTHDTDFRVEFTWLDPPDGSADVFLWWSYVTDVRMEPAR
jgi:hypothetical protein